MSPDDKLSNFFKGKQGDCKGEGRQPPVEPEGEAVEDSQARDVGQAADDGNLEHGSEVNDPVPVKL